MHWQLAAIAVFSLVTSILSGAGGAGGGFLGLPLMIALGLTPAEAIATSKISGVGTSFGALGGFGKSKYLRASFVIPTVLLAFAIGLIAPHVIASLDQRIYRRAIGIVLIALAPLILWKKPGSILKIDAPSRWMKVAGSMGLVVGMFLQAILSSGLGILVMLSLMSFFGLTALEANVTRRYSHLVLNITTILGLLFTGLIVWNIAAIRLASNLLGGFIGARLALRRGSTFVVYVFALLAVLSGVDLLIG